VERALTKQQVLAEIDQRQNEIIGVAKAILAEPELGFKEWKTAAKVKKVFEGLGLQTREGLAITGVDATLHGALPGPTVLVMGELDSVMDPQSPVCDPTTGAAHLCGHHTQIAAMLGAAMGLTCSGAAQHLAGNVRFLAVPAEEFIEIEYRLGLVRDGKLSFVGGKPELIKLGYFDDVDMAMMVHSQPDCPQPGFFLRGEGNGFVAKFVQFKGISAHAGASPHLAVNASLPGHPGYPCPTRDLSG
jgi:amidohydrolase